TNEEAKDLTQAFFARALERRTFEAYDPQVARFRTFIRSCLDHFVANAEESRRALKRGGGLVPLSLHFDEAEEELARAGVVESATDESAFDADWVKSLFDMSVEALRSELSARGRDAAWTAFE